MRLFVSPIRFFYNNVYRLLDSDNEHDYCIWMEVVNSIRSRNAHLYYHGPIRIIYLRLGKSPFMLMRNNKDV